MVSLADHALPIGATLLDGQFTITGHLGAGGFGKTYRAQDNYLDRTIVIKECFPEDFCARDGLNVVMRNDSYEGPFRATVEMFVREARAVARLRHPNIVGVHRVFEENQTAYMVLDLIEGCELLSILESPSATLSPSAITEILLQLLDAIEKVHGMDLLHRDISPDNIMIEPNGTPVLIDFGAARRDASRKTRAVSSMLVVKDGYSPQEFYVAGAEQAPSSDLYALAATFYHLLSDEVPANSQTRLVEIAGRRADPCKPLAGRIPGYAPEFLEAIDKAMQIHPCDRLQSAAEWRDLISKGLAAPAAEPAPVEQPVTKVAQPAPQAAQPAPAPAAAQAPAEEPASAEAINPELERVLTKLVEETNAAVTRSQGIPVTPKKRRTPAPRKSVRPEWVDEFNRESVEIEKWRASSAFAMEKEHRAPDPVHKRRLETLWQAAEQQVVEKCTPSPPKPKPRTRVPRSMGKLLDFSSQKQASETDFPDDPNGPKRSSRSLWRKAS